MSLGVKGLRSIALIQFVLNTENVPMYLPVASLKPMLSRCTSKLSPYSRHTLSGQQLPDGTRNTVRSIQSRSKSLQPSAAPQPPENDGKMSAARHRHHRVFGGQPPTPPAQQHRSRQEPSRSGVQRLAFSVWRLASGVWNMFGHALGIHGKQYNLCRTFTVTLCLVCRLVICCHCNLVPKL